MVQITFTERTGAANPLNGFNVGNNSTPALADLDADGDLDVVSGHWSGFFNYFNNTGTSNNPKFVEVTGASNPFDGVGTTGSSAPALVDLDADGDLDVVSGDKIGSFSFYKNTGSSNNPKFVQQTGTANPLSGFDVGYYSTPTLVDLDEDGDFDAFSGEEKGGFVYYKNMGSSNNPKLLQYPNPLGSFNVGNGGHSTPTLADIDADGDFDAFSGTWDGVFSYYKNTGNSTNPQFAEQIWTENPLYAFDVGEGGASGSTPVLVDLDADGDLDLISGNSSGNFNYYENTTPPNTAPSFFWPIPTYNLTDIIENETVLNGNTIAEIITDGTISDPDTPVEAVAITAVDNSNGTWQYSTDEGSTWKNFGPVSETTARLLDSNHKVRFIPNANWSGAADLTLRLWDKSTGIVGGTANTSINGGKTAFSTESTTAKITVNNVNNAPSFAIPVTYNLTDIIENETVLNGNTIAQIITDGTISDPDTPVEAVAITAADNTNGTWQYSLDGGSTWTNFGPVSETTARLLDSSNKVRFIPNANWSGAADLTLRLWDKSTGVVGGTANTSINGGKTAFSTEITTAKITVNNVNNAPSFATFTFAIFSEVPNENPLNGVDVGNNSAPVLVDLDADGDLDAISGASDGTFKYFKNTGTSNNPQLTQQTGTSNPLNGFDVGSNSAPVLVDLDKDGDLDAISGTSNGNLKYFKNTGTSNNPQFVEQTGTSNPLNGFDVGSNSAPALVDLDKDGDLDAISGTSNGNLKYFKNTGTSNNPQFVEQTGTNNPLNGFDLGSNSTPVLVDLDEDGNLDLISGEFTGIFKYLKNTGSSKNPKFVEKTGTNNPLNEFDVGNNSTPVLVDLDTDGDLDALSGELNGNFKYYQNNSQVFKYNLTDINEDETTQTGETIAEIIPESTIADSDSPTVGIAITAADNTNGNWQYSTDGGINWISLDVAIEATAILLDSSSKIRFIPNQDWVGTANITLRLWDKSTGVVGETADTSINGGSTAFSSETRKATITVNSLNDAPSFARFTELPGANNPLNGFDVGGESTPALVDLDGDGDLDAISGASDGTFKYYNNTGTSNNPKFVEVTGTNNPLNSFDVGDDSTPALVDLDKDGDLDVVSGEYDGFLNYYKNTGSSNNPKFLELPGTNNPLNGFNVGYNSNPVLVDIDGDGDLDAFIGEKDGSVNYYKNTGTSQNPQFLELPGANNPLNGFDVGDKSAPVLVDLDEDGDLDAFIGAKDGHIRYYKNTGTSQNPQFVEQTDGNNPLNKVDVGDGNAPALADLDADGDLDAFIGEKDGNFNYFKNNSELFPYNLTAVNENETAPTGNTIAEIITDGTVFDPEGAIEAVAITAVDNSNGTWQYSTDGGNTWNNFDTVTEATARLLDSTDKVRFIPKANWFGTANITLRLWDKTTGDIGETANTTSNGGETAFSRQTTIAKVTVNDVPDAPVEINLNPTNLKVVEGLNSEAVIEITGAAAGVTVQYQTQDNEALAGSDYTNSNGQYTFGVGETSKQITIPILNDNINEPDKTFKVIVENKQATVTITDTQEADITTQLNNKVENLTLTGEGNINGTGNAGNNVITGNNGNNTLSGLGGNDQLVGKSGSDNLNGGLGADTLEGGTENDTYYVDNVGDKVTEKAGEGTADRVISSIDYTLTEEGNIENLTLNGSSPVKGTGNSQINNLVGNSKNNKLIGLGGNDTLNGAAGADTMEGGTENDTYYVDNPADVVTEVAGQGTADRVYSYLEDYILPEEVENLNLLGEKDGNGTGNNLNNSITGDSSDNFLTGEAGNDVLNGGVGIDTMEGGADNDTYYVDNSEDVVSEITGEGTADKVISSSNDYILPEEVETLSLSGNIDGKGTGNNLNNSITGDNSDNILQGLAGNDILNGGVGADTMFGGIGNEIYYVDNSADVVLEVANQGTDRIISYLPNYTLGETQNVEQLSLAGTGNINGTGNSFANALYGNAGVNTLTGLNGNDILVGYAGNDVLTGGEGSDRFYFYSPSEGVDNLTDFSTGTDKIYIKASGFLGGLTAGTLTSDKFVEESAAANSSQRFIYNNGALSYDVDGNGATNPVAIASLTGSPALSAGDIVIF